VVFLIKCFVFIAIVVAALQMNSPDPPSAARESHAHATPEKPPRRPQVAETARSLARAGTDAIASAARDKCLSAPRDCAAVFERLQGSPRDR
jgi:hypothetical protein